MKPVLRLESGRGNIGSEEERAMIVKNKDRRAEFLQLTDGLYGKLAQRSGRGPYHDRVSAGLITAAIRARLIEAQAQDPEAVFMLATDAVYTTRPSRSIQETGSGNGKPRFGPICSLCSLVSTGHLPSRRNRSSHVVRLVPSSGTPRHALLLPLTNCTNACVRPSSGNAG